MIARKMKKKKYPNCDHAFLQAKESKTEKKGIAIKQTAYHEAGHAVMAYILHLRLKEVSIIPTDDYLGVCIGGKRGNIDPEWDSSHKTRVELERRAMQALAGNVAEHLLTGKRHRAGSYSDYHNVVNLLSCLAGDDEITYYADWLWHRTKATMGIDYWWLAVENVAEELLKNKHLKNKCVREIIRRAIDEDYRRKTGTKALQSFTGKTA